KQYVEAFTRLSATTYAGRFKSFDGEEFKLLGAEDTSRGDTVVKTEIITSKKEHVAINYLMRKTDAGWRVIDVFVKGTISEVATKRSDFGAVLNQSGFDGLMAAIEKKIADAKAG
ncbi:MAG TPA: ABC transporter substrate-binding protein, partial [Roseiflexaceae bacterium]|nr:ABC transporter substrate-binding protein [Roseiflexaceae bacterium]